MVYIDMYLLSVGNRRFDRMYVKSYGYDDVFIKEGRTVIQTCITQTDEDYEFCCNTHG